MDNLHSWGGLGALAGLDGLDGLADLAELAGIADPADLAGLAGLAALTAQRPSWPLLRQRGRKNLPFPGKPCRVDSQNTPVAAFPSTRPPPISQIRALRSVTAMGPESTVGPMGSSFPDNQILKSICL